MKNIQCNIVIGLSTLIFGITFHSCSLDENLPSTPTLSDIETIDNLNSMAIGMYSSLNSANAFKAYGFYMLALSGDDLYGSGTTNLNGFGDGTFSAVQTSYMWNSLYSTIGRANTVLQLADDIHVAPSFEAQRDQYRGEACFVRAFCYYYLVQMFGAVPLRLDPFSEFSNFYAPRADVEKVYQQIFADLTIANHDCLPVDKMPINCLGRATKGAAQALMASSNLVFANWLDLNRTSNAEYYEQTINWCDSVINSGKYKLYDDYAFLWNVVNEPVLSASGGEVIYSIQFAIDQVNSATGSSGSMFAASYLPTNYPGGVGAATAQGAINVTPGFINDYWTDEDYVKLGNRSAPESYPEDMVDYRLETSFLTQWANASGHPIFACPFPHKEGEAVKRNNNTNSVAKYIDPNSRDNRNSENDLNIFRLAEIYLIRAEAHAELGQMDEAVEDLNTVRKRSRRRGTTDDNHSEVPRLLAVADVADAGVFREILLKERGLELVGECKRWLDLVRMKSPDGTETMFTYRFRKLADNREYSRIPPIYDATTFTWNNASYINYDAIKNICEYTKRPNKYELFPLPVSEMTNNPSITQNNPGW